MPFNFDVIERGRITAERMNPNVVRITRNGNISVGEGVSKRLGAYATRSKNGGLGVYIGIAYDDHQQAIRLFPRKDGFRMTVNEETGNGQMNMPKGLEKYSPPRGDYLLVDGETDVYKLAR